MAGQAFSRALKVVSTLHPECGLLPEKFIERKTPLESALHAAENPLLLVANPHALHTPAIVAGAQAGARAIITEKPACVSLQQLAELEQVSTPVYVCHGYRAMWGPRQMQQMIRQGDLGEIVSVEGLYWQSSAAQRMLDPSPAFQLWKNDPLLSGPFDALVDLGSHWIDLAFFLMSEPCREMRAWLSYANAEAPHRDTHVHLDLIFGSGRRGRASISKTVHGASNDLQITVLGTQVSLTTLNWSRSR